MTTTTAASATTPAGATVGAVVALWRYPVKSMLGEELNAAELTDRGLAGDRAYALVDRETGKVVSAKNPRKWGQLFDCRAAFVAPPQPSAPPPPVRIELPDGRVMTSGEDDVDGSLSALLGRAVTLKTVAPAAPSLEEYWPDIDGLVHREVVTDEGIGFGAPPGNFYDAFPIHLLTTATLERLRSLYPAGRFEVRRFRPNLVVAANGADGFVENAWVGRSVAVGDGIRLQVTGPCPRCVMTTLPQGDLPRDVGILRAAADHNRVPIPAFNNEPMPSVGAYAAVERGGALRRGDPVRLD
jgi:uncharacterized protein YcbX